MTLSAPFQSRARIVVAAGALVIVIVLGLALFRDPSRTTKPAASLILELPLSELQLRAGRLYSKSDTNAFTGWMFERYPDGTLKSRTPVLNGLLHGISQGWHTNGQLQVTETFREGVSQGVRTKRYPNGNKLSEASIVDGQLHGLFRRWHENGALAEEVNMNHGQPDGPAKSYSPDGSLIRQFTLRSGKIIEQ